MSFNPSKQQKDIIAAPLGPMRISAGAGTGKTTTLSARVAHLVAEKDIPPESVLGITFTNKAAEELTERVRSFLGASVEPGREVEVHTYHGFAAQILAEFGSLIGVERGAGIITPTFGRQLIFNVLATYPFEKVDATWMGSIDRIARLAAQLGDHLLTAADVVVPASPDEVWHMRQDLLVAIAAYDEEKHRLQVVDYADLVTKAFRLVTQHQDVRDRLLERYQVVVLDEYQDTNPAQRELIRAIFPPGFPVMAVGDPDQTIYEWRGASLENFDQFPEHFGEFEPAPTFPLTLNRRSGSSVLAIANGVRFEIERQLRLALVPLDGAPSGAVYTRWERTSADEAEWIADRIAHLHEQGRSWRDMAVLVRKNRSMGLIHDALTQREIPVEVANLGGLLSVPEVTDLYCWLRLLDSPDDGPALMRILLGGRFRLGLGDLMPLRQWVRTTMADDDLAEDHERLPAASLLEATEHFEDLVGLDPRTSEALSQFLDEYRLLLQVAQGVTLVELCRRILDITGAWAEVESMPAATRLSARLNLYRFLDLAEEWSPLEGRPSLPAFVSYLREMQKEPSEELDTARLSGEDAVTLLTIHRAKGLEWPVVFIPAVVKGTFPSRSAGFDNPFERGYFIPYELRLDRESLPPLEDADEKERRELLGRRHTAQEWRIAYVAVTRAKEEVYLTGSFWYGSAQYNARASQPSDLFNLVRDHQATTDLGGVAEPGKQPEVARVDWGNPVPDPLFAEGWDEGFRKVLEDTAWTERIATELGLVDEYRRHLAEYTQLVLALPIDQTTSDDTRSLEVSVTGLVTYATCPRQFYWSEVDRLPRQSSAAASRGVDVHRRIELHNLGKVPLTDFEFDLYDLPERSVEAGNAFTVFSASRFAETKPLLVEAPFQLLLDDGVWVRGRIDAVYPLPNGGWEIVDFKSGRPATREPIQLQAYAIAANKVRFAVAQPSHVEVTFAFLGDGQLVVETQAADEPYMQQAEKRMLELTNGIAAGKFEPTPGPACHGCDFVRFCQQGRAYLAALK